MREHKYRVWDKAQERMLYSYIPDDQPKREYILVEFGIGFSHYDSEQLEVMEWTGLQDKNGKEIYENDLLQNESGRIAVVGWHKIAAMFDCEPVVIVKNDNSDGFKNSCWSRYISVIGNIHENPELLEVDHG